MAGHPTIGSTFALAKEGVIKPGQSDFVFGLNIGPTPVSLTWDGAALDFAWMTQKNPEFGDTIRDRAGFARALGVDVKDLGDAPPQLVTCGTPFLFAALSSRAAVDSVSLDLKAYDAACQVSGLKALPLFIFVNASQPYPAQNAQAWGAALLLLLFVLVINVLVRGRSLGRRAR